MAKKKDKKAENINTAKQSIRNKSDETPSNSVFDLKNKLNEKSEDELAYLKQNVGKKSEDDLSSLKDKLKDNSETEETSVDSLKEKLPNISIEDVETEGVKGDELEKVLEEVIKTIKELETVKEPIAPISEEVIEEIPSVKKIQEEIERLDKNKESLNNLDIKPKKESKSKSKPKPKQEKVSKDEVKVSFEKKDKKDGYKLFRTITTSSSEFEINITTILDNAKMVIDNTDKPFKILHKGKDLMNCYNFRGELFFGVEYLIINIKKYHYNDLEFIAL